MNLRTLWLAVALGASPLVAHAQISADVSFGWNSAPPAESIDSTDVFYDQLAPYGVWVNDPTVGEAFIPDQPDFVPYTNGHWENTDVGFVWISDEPFSWATSHYGRWWFSNDYGRWMWIPDTEWGPNWVDWYDAGGDLGWAPLAPQVVIDAGYQMPYTAYHYCPADHILDPDVTRYYEPRDRVEVIQRQARPIAARANIGSHQIIRGPAPERLAAHHVRAEVKHIAPKQMGRMSSAEVRTAEQRAQQRKPQIEQQNARRLDQHAQIKKVVEQRSMKAPVRPNTPVAPANDRERNPVNDRTPNPRVNDIDRPRATPQATPPAANPRSDIDRDREKTPPEPTRTTRPGPQRPEPNRAEPNRAEPNRVEPNRAEPNRAEPNRAEPNRPEPNRAEPNRAEPNRVEPNRVEPNRVMPTRPEPQRTEPARPERTEPARPERPEMNRPEPQRTEPTRPERAEPTRPEPQRAEPPRPEPRATVPRPEPRGHERNDKSDDKRH